MHRMRFGAAVGIVSLHLMAGVAIGQSPTPSSPYPTTDSPVTLPSGTVVRVRNLVVFAGPRGNSLTLYIQSPTPAADSARLAREAKELVHLHGAAEGLGPVTQVIVGVCRTQACLEMREVPSEMFVFVAQPDGSWQAQVPTGP